MKKLGTVKNVIHDGTILLGASGTDVRDIPRQGARVFDSRGVEVGTVSRVFGPVKEPYISLRPTTRGDNVGLLGTALYLGAEERPARKEPSMGGRRPPERGRGKRPYGAKGKKGVKKWQRKEKPRKK